MSKNTKYALYLLAAILLLGRLNLCDTETKRKSTPSKTRSTSQRASSPMNAPQADFSQALAGLDAQEDAQSDATVYQVKRVIDGDTIVITNGNEDIRVRLIGVDTPETVHPNKPVQHFGKEASDYLKNLLTGKEVRLGFDPANAAGKNRDRYGRALAYVYRHPDGLFVNEAIIRGGYGFAYVKFPFQHLERFRALEREAREKGVGLWGE